MKVFSKILIGLFIVTLHIGLTGCSKNNDDSDMDRTTRELLVGTWTITEYDFDITVEERSLLDYLIEVEGIPASEAAEMYAFFEAFLEAEVTGTLTLKSDNTYISDFGEGSTFGTWVLSPDEKTLTLTEGGESTVLFINFISNSTWKATITESSPEDLDDNPETPDVVVSVEIQITLTK